LSIAATDSMFHQLKSQKIAYADAYNRDRKHG